MHMWEAQRVGLGELGEVAMTRIHGLQRWKALGALPRHVLIYLRGQRDLWDKIRLVLWRDHFVNP